jgi:molecular chaperone GrpE
MADRERDHVSTGEPPGSPESPSTGPLRGQAASPPATRTEEQQSEQLERGDGDVAALQAERDELFDRLQRLAAEFDNFRKRSAREAATTIERANERLVKELLPILDDLARALEAAEVHEEVQLEEGVRLVHRSLADLLAKEGLAEIDTEGQFDPHVHEALLSQPSDAQEGDVIEVVQKGYTLGDKVLRPARVVVSAGTSPAVEEDDED